MFYAVEHGDFVVFCCRTPHGVRGLKFNDYLDRELEDERRTPHGVRGLKLPNGWLFTSRIQRRTPHGVRGLKSQCSRTAQV